MTGSANLAAVLLDCVARAARGGACDRILLVGPGVPVAKRLRPQRARIVCACTDARLHAELKKLGYATVAIPAMSGARMDRLKSALVTAMNAGLVQVGERVLCAVSGEDGGIDMLIDLMAKEEIRGEHSTLLAASLKTRVPAPLLEVLLDLSLRIGREGYEGRPLGTLIVVGDSTRVLEQSAPLTLNPFQGYSEIERTLFDHDVRSAVRNFAMLDGAFIVREDGVVVAAARHIRVSAQPQDLPMGYGTRHVAAAAITLSTDALAIAVSQSSGKVRLFEKGTLILELDPGTRRGVHEWSSALPKTTHKPQKRQKRPPPPATLRRGRSKSSAPH